MPSTVRRGTRVRIARSQGGRDRVADSGERGRLRVDDCRREQRPAHPAGGGRVCSRGSGPSARPSTAPRSEEARGSHVSRQARHGVPEQVSRRRQRPWSRWRIRQQRLRRRRRRRPRLRQSRRRRKWGGVSAHQGRCVHLRQRRRRQLRLRCGPACPWSGGRSEGRAEPLDAPRLERGARHARAARAWLHRGRHHVAASAASSAQALAQGRRVPHPAPRRPRRAGVRRGRLEPTLLLLMPSDAFGCLRMPSDAYCALPICTCSPIGSPPNPPWLARLLVSAVSGTTPFRPL